MIILGTGITQHTIHPVWFLVSKNTTYVVGSTTEGTLLNLYWGQRLLRIRDIELPVSQGTQYEYESHRTLVYSYTQSMSTTCLVIVLKDKIMCTYEVHLKYSLDIENDTITRSVTLLNTSQVESVMIPRALSATYYLPPSSTRGLVSRSWVHERPVLLPGTTYTVHSESHYPYFAMIDHDQEYGKSEVYFGTVEWSDRGYLEIEVSMDGLTTIRGGLHAFSVSLSTGDHIELPRFTVGFTQDGLTGARRQLTRHNNEKETRVHSVLYNGWLNTTQPDVMMHCKEIMKKAAGLGLELFILDQGWFRRWYGDRTGLGDHCKLQFGLKVVADEIHRLGMQLGVWVQPDKISVDSDLYRAHPDWVYHDQAVQGNQKILNIGMKDVQHCILSRLINVIYRLNITYIKWDVSQLTLHTDSRLPRIRHMSSLYNLIHKLKSTFPHLLIETCSSQGEHIDLQMMEGVDLSESGSLGQPDAQLVTHYNASFVIPPKMMNSWVTHAHTPLSYRFHLGFLSTLGLSMDLSTLSTQDWETCKGWIALYKQIRHIQQLGTLDWLVVPTHSMAVTQTYHEQESVVLAFRTNPTYSTPLKPLRLRHLIPHTIYQVRIWHLDPSSSVYDNELSGASLMNRGLSLPYLKSPTYSSVVIWIKKLSNT